MMKLDERKRPYNSMAEVKEPTKEEMEAYFLKKKNEADPMAHMLWVISAQAQNDCLTGNVTVACRACIPSSASKAEEELKWIVLCDVQKTPVLVTS